MPTTAVVTAVSFRDPNLLKLAKLRALSLNQSLSGYLSSLIAADLRGANLLGANSKVEKALSEAREEAASRAVKATRARRKQRGEEPTG